jgi:hypothetical protein
MARKKTSLGDNSPALISAGVQYFRRSFDSVKDALAYIETTAPQKGAGVSSHKVDEWAPYWHGTKDFSACAALALHGWNDGAEKVKNGIATGTKKTSAGARLLRKKFLRKYDVSGDECDVARYISGDPENMIETTRTIAKGKTVRKIKVSVSFSGGCSASKIEEYAVAVACAVQRIESAGNRVELWAEKTSCQNLEHATRSPISGAAFVLSVKIKSADARIAPAALAFACHPSFQRRIAFAILERTPGASLLSNDSNGYGNTSRPGDMAGYLTKEAAFWSDIDLHCAITELNAA